MPFSAVAGRGRIRSAPTWRKRPRLPVAFSSSRFTPPWYLKNITLTHDLPLSRPTHGNARACGFEVKLARRPRAMEDPDRPLSSPEEKRCFFPLEAHPANKTCCPSPWCPMSPGPAAAMAKHWPRPRSSSAHPRNTDMGEGRKVQLRSGPETPGSPPRPRSAPVLAGPRLVPPWWCRSYVPTPPLAAVLTRSSRSFIRPAPGRNQPAVPLPFMDEPPSRCVQRRSVCSLWGAKTVKDAKNTPFRARSSVPRPNPSDGPFRLLGPLSGFTPNRFRSA